MKSAKSILIVAALVFVSLSMSAPSAEQDETKPARVTTTRTTTHRATARPDIVRRIPPVDPHKETVVLLEAFMVEVKLSTLHSLGVPAISKGDDFVTVEHIIKLIKTTDAATVTAGAKLALTHENKAKSESTTRKAIYPDPHNNSNIQYFDVGTSFTAIAEIRKEKVFTEIEFEYSDIVKGDESAHAMPQIVERNWASTVCLKPGEPTIAGATQDGDLAAFLIVTANIKE